MAAKPLCSIADCGKVEVNSRGWCIAHYHRWRKHGDPLIGGPLRRRTANGEPWRYFEDEVLPYRGDDCLTWPYANVKGYGIIRIDGKAHLVSRLVCEATHGAAPTPEHEAAHSCGRGQLGCVAKAHLSWKTPVENKADELIHGTRNRGARNGMAKLTENDVIAIRSLHGKVTPKRIAEQFSVSCWTIYDILRGRYWDWIG